MITKPPTYDIIVLSPLNANGPHQARVFLHSASFIRKLSKRTMLEHCRTLNSPSSHVCDKPHKSRHVVHAFSHEYGQYRLIAPSPPFQGDSVTIYSVRSSPARQSVTNADTYYLTLHYDQVRFIVPPPQKRGGQSCTSSYLERIAFSGVSLS